MSELRIENFIWNYFYIETSFCENDLSLSQYKASAKSVQKVKGTQISYNSYCQGGRSGLIKLSNTPELCLKITEKVAFNTASEASYVYIFEWIKVWLKIQKLNFKKPDGWLRSNSVTRQVTFNRTKVGGKYQIQMRHFKYFSNNVNKTYGKCHDLKKGKNWKIKKNRFKNSCYFRVLQ